MFDLLLFGLELLADGGDNKHLLMFFFLNLISG
jgi:hypothetical protein